MSNAPYLLANARSGLRMGHTDTQDSLFTDGLEDAETGDSMGSFAQETADKYQLTREEMDEYAIESVNRSQAAIKKLQPRNGNCGYGSQRRKDSR